MSQVGHFKIDVAESFPWLAKDPIVEAVIELRARAEAQWNESEVRDQLTRRLPEYPDIQSQREIQLETTFGSGGLTEATHREQWRGIRFSSADNAHIAQFNRDGFMFSRLPPYQDWNELCDETMRLWRIYTELARPSEVQRLGVRYINRISGPVDGFQVEDYLQVAPQPPSGIPLQIARFFHQDTFEVPGYPYAINLSQAVQPQLPQTAGDIALIVDIDVFTTQPFESNDAAVKKRLTEMRWLKDKMFFGSLRPDAIARFR